MNGRRVIGGCVLAATLLALGAARAEEFRADVSGRWRDLKRQGCIPEPAANAWVQTHSDPWTTFQDVNEVGVTSYGWFVVEDMTADGRRLHVPIPVTSGEGPGITSRMLGLRMYDTGGNGPNPADTNTPPWWNDGSNGSFYRDDLLGNLSNRTVTIRFAFVTNRAIGAPFGTNEVWGDTMDAEGKFVSGHPTWTPTIQLAFAGPHADSYRWLSEVTGMSLYNLRDGVYTNITVALAPLAQPGDPTPWVNLYDGHSASNSVSTVAAFNEDIGNVQRWFVTFRSGYRTEGFGFNSAGTGITNAEFVVDYFRSREPGPPPSDAVLILR